MIKTTSIVALVILMSVSVSTFAQIGKSKTENKELSLDLATFTKPSKTYKHGGLVIPKKDFGDILKTNENAGKIYAQGKKIRVASVVLASLSAVGITYYTNQYIQDDDALLDVPKELAFSYIGLMGAAILNYYGKNKIQLGVNEYNGKSVTTENPIRVNLSSGYPAFGLWSLGSDQSLDQSMTLSVGVEAQLYNNWFGYVDGYMQSANTTFDKSYNSVMRWEEQGNSIIVGLGFDHELIKNLHFVGKYGFGLTTIDRDIFFDRKHLSRDEDENQVASQLGVGLRYFPTNHFAVGANANLATNTPLFNFGITAAF